MAETTTYHNEFFEGKDPNSSFVEKPLLSNLTQAQLWDDQAKYYFLPFLINCYKFTVQHKLPHFTLMCSPTFIFYRDRLVLRCYDDTIHNAFFKTMEMCGLLDEPIMLLVEKRFHIYKPIDGGTQQLYNMLWDYDLSPSVKNCYICYTPIADSTQFEPNPDVEQDDLWLSRRTLWFQDDLNFLCQKFTLDGEYESEEVLDLSNVPEEKQSLYKPRTFYFKTFQPRDVDSSESELESSDSDLEEDIDYFDIDSTQTGLLDSTLDLEKDDDEMKKILAFFANMPKVTGLVQGMLDMMTSLTRILPLVAQKLDDTKEDEKKLRGALEKTISILNLGVDKVLKICRFLGLKVEKKPSGAVALIVKDRFKKNKKDFIEYEIDELNNSLDSLENVDDDKKVKPVDPKPLPDVTPNNLYPQRMQLHPIQPNPIKSEVHKFLAGDEDKPAPLIDLTNPPPSKPESDKSELVESGESKLQPPPIPPKVMPEPPPAPPKDENGIK